MRIFDVSMTIEEEMMVYKNRVEKRPRISLEKSFITDGFNESAICMNLHTGTHIDAPYHMQRDGDTVENLDLEKLIAPCQVFDLTHVEGGITKSDLIRLQIKKSGFVLFKTRNSLHDKSSLDFIYLTKSGAEYLADQSVMGVGIDSLGIERDQPSHATHNILFDQGIIIIEGLRLRDIQAGEYFMMALPLKIKGTDGAPARVVLMKPTELEEAIHARP